MVAFSLLSNNFKKDDPNSDSVDRKVSVELEMLKSKYKSQLPIQKNTATMEESKAYEPPLLGPNQ